MSSPSCRRGGIRASRAPWPKTAAGEIGEADIHWLEADVACDLVTVEPLSPVVRERLERLALDEGVDCVVQEQAGRRKRILLADMDSTMIDQECIDELAAAIGIKDQVAAITARAMNGEIAFEPALRERVALLKDLPVSHRRRHRPPHHA